MKPLRTLVLALGGAIAVSCGCEAPPLAPAPNAGPPSTAPGGAPLAREAPAVEIAAGGPGDAPAKGPFPQSTDPALRDPLRAVEKAPATFAVRMDTTAGAFEMLCTRSWAPHGADRIYNLVKIGFFDDVAFFRVVKQPRPFIVQFGIHGNPEVSRVWSDARLGVDKPTQSNVRGTVTYAMAGRPDTRTTQLFVNFSDNPMLDKMGFAPVCKVTGNGMEVVDAIESVYGEEPSSDQSEMQRSGNTVLRNRFPLLDYIKTARLVANETERAR